MNEARNEAARQAKQNLRGQVAQDGNRVKCQVNGRTLELAKVAGAEYWYVDGNRVDPRLVVRELAA